MDKENTVLFKETLFDKIFKPEIITLENGHSVRRRKSRAPFIAAALVLAILWAFHMTEFDFMVIISRFDKLLDLLLLEKDEVAMKEVNLSAFLEDVEKALDPVMKEKQIR